MKSIPPLASYLMAAAFLGVGGLMLFWRKGPNWWIGVRLPWTYADRQIWDRSWRLGAIFLVGHRGGGPGFQGAHLLILGLLYPIYLYWRKYGTLCYWKDPGRLDYRPVAKCRQCLSSTAGRPGGIDRGSLPEMPFRL